MSVFNEGPRLSDWLKGETETPTDHCRDAVTILAGEELVTGAVLGKITATGKWVAFDPGASDGSQTAAGILVTILVEGDTSVDSEASVLVRGPGAIAASGLTWLTGVNSGQKTTALASLKALGIIAREEA